MKYLVGLCLAVVSVYANAPADWDTCKTNPSAGTVTTVNEEQMHFESWPDCHVKIYQSPQADTLYIRKGTKDLWWESYGHHQKIGNGFHKWLPETQLEITVANGEITLKIGENAQNGMYGLCVHQFNSRDPPCVEAWGVGGGPP